MGGELKGGIGEWSDQNFMYTVYVHEIFIKAFNVKEDILE